jgi:hypothetical protein
MFGSAAQPTCNAGFGSNELLGNKSCNHKRPD